MLNVLICDDNVSVHESLSSYLKADNMRVLSAYDGEEVLEIMKKEPVDFLILDVMLPKMFGTEVLRQIRRENSVPILMLSARNDEIDRIIGLELGADDYVTKPFSPREVAVRVKAILRRMKREEKENEIVRAELRINLDSYETFVGEQRIDLSPRETEVLHFLAKNKGRVLSRNQIMNGVWGYDFFGDTRAVDNQIKRIRQKLPTENVHFEIKAVYGVGYKFEVTE